MSEEKFEAHGITCSGCKREKFVNAKALEKRIEKYGSIEEIEKRWLCNKCKRDRKENKDE
jgi:transposase-like protein|tara:strand:- start:601 stop:780 length:180 start_codon:yes stop_codon:yes gene_type:complete